MTVTIMKKLEWECLKTWVGIFQVGIFWVGIFQVGIFQREVWWVGIFRVGVLMIPLLFCCLEKIFHTSTFANELVVIYFILINLIKRQHFIKCIAALFVKLFEIDIFLSHGNQPYALSLRFISFFMKRTSISNQLSISIPPENPRKKKVFWRFYGV